MFGDFDTFLRHFPASFGLAASLNRSEISSAEMREFDILHQFYTQRSNNMSISAGNKVCLHVCSSFVLQIKEICGTNHESNIFNHSSVSLEV